MRIDELVGTPAGQPVSATPTNVAGTPTANPNQPDRTTKIMQVMVSIRAYQQQ